MPTRNAKSRPHCVDIAPSTFASNANSGARSASRNNQRTPARAGKALARHPETGVSGMFRSLTGRSGQSKNHRLPGTGNTSVARTLIASSPRGGSYRQPDIHTGAVRRTGETAIQRPSHFGKLLTALALITGAVVWTTGASESLSPILASKPETMQAAIAPPAFFFDDNADALDRSLSDILSGGASSIAAATPNEPSDIVAMATLQNYRNAGVNQDISLANIAAVPDIISVTQSELITTEQTPATILLADDTITGLTESLLDTPVDSVPDTPANEFGSHKVTVSLGDTLSGILNENGLKAELLNQLLTNDVVKDYLSNINVGQVFELVRNDSGDFESLTTRVSSNRRVNIERTQFGFDVTTIELPIVRQRVATSGKINQSLYLAAERANLKQSTIMDLADIFQWELDFARDIREGDRFSLVYDRLYREGEYIGDGDILAAEFFRGGKSYNAVRFTTDEGKTGYYSPEGKSKRRTFMRHPVDVVRITSKFNPNRLHPVLHQIRAHRGVDYGSPHGSPIYATADGRVTYSGNKSAYGKTVVLKHGEKFSTLYAHMSRISDKSQVGKRVKQGDVIGYVGKTGRVTGTHLHYEFRVNGKQIDPLKVELPAAAPIDKKYLVKLKTISNEMSQLMAQARDDASKQVAAGPSQDSLLSEARR